MTYGFLIAGSMLTVQLANVNSLVVLVHYCVSTAVGAPFVVLFLYATGAIRLPAVLSFSVITLFWVFVAASGNVFCQWFRAKSLLITKSALISGVSLLSILVGVGIDLLWTAKGTQSLPITGIGFIFLSALIAFSCVARGGKSL